MDDIVPDKFALGDPPISRLSDAENLGLRPVYRLRLRTSQESSDEGSTDASLTVSTDSDAREYEIPSSASLARLRT